MNRDKTQLFYAGLSQDKTNALSAYGFSVGSLPIHYLGLPLMHLKLKIAEYAPLMDKLHSRFTSWAAKSLSFDGRCLLIKIVITGTVNFWISTFQLPKSCVKKIESLYSRFLWSGSLDKHPNVKVSWTTACLPKLEGGIGLRSFRKWNLTLTMRLVWLLFSGSDSLWVAWHRTYNCRSSYHFWSQDELPSHSWNWRYILRLRELVSNFLISEVKNGYSTSFWFDNWCPLGPLIDIFGREGTRNLRVHIDVSVADACNAQGWSLPHPRSDQEVALHSFLTSIPLPSLASDSDTEKHIWFSGATPKHAFHNWVTNVNKLPTRSRLASWGMQIPTTCCVCSSQPETRDHLMLTCPYATLIWTEVRRRMRTTVPLFTDWSQLIQWSSTSTVTAPFGLRYMATAKYTCMLHNHNLVPVMVLFKDINRQVINSIYALRNMKKFKPLMLLWLI
ncbi:hypothetical protein Bca52824_044976 [Brassica carinata]|uniref:Reverse transcriptase zinc-binding domain-containing protein n=1 Tax=Brassica carinata TaxID=52824 RepID=A0A8X7RCX2_BRACI|nr:hypothetical protein Bca52824_044976 [Brassica carinata]